MNDPAGGSPRKPTLPLPEPLKAKVHRRQREELDILRRQIELIEQQRQRLAAQAAKYGGRVQELEDSLESSHGPAAPRPPCHWEPPLFFSFPLPLPLPLPLVLLAAGAGWLHGEG